MALDTRNADWDACQAILPRVSRTFALSIRMLPPTLSRATTVAYLICRVADTIEDDTSLPPATRRAILLQWRSAIAGTSDLQDAIGNVGQSADERTLMHAVGAVHRSFQALAESDRAIVRRWSVEMMDGMMSSLPVGLDPNAPLFQDMAQLERYCYFVAGTVGHMLTELFQGHCHSIRGNRFARMRELSTHFGLGLQFTNIIRDAERDRREGRVFVPATLWKAEQLEPRQFFDGSNDQASWAVVNPLLVRADKFLRDAFVYSMSVPRRAFRIRLFCIVQLFFARRTLALVRRNASRGIGTTKVKMSRQEVYALLAVSAVFAPFNSVLGRLYAWLGHAG